MAITENKVEPIEEKKEESPRYYVEADYTAQREEEKFVVEVYLPGVAKDTIKIQSIKDYIEIHGTRDDIRYYLHLDLYFDTNPTKVKAIYHEGLLRLELPISDPMEEAKEIKIE